MQDDLTLALWQTAYTPTTAEALQRLDATAAQARAQGAELLITPEMFLTGYAIGADRVAALAEPSDGPLAQAVSAIAQHHGIAIVYGYPEHNPSGKPFNAAQAMAPDGTRPMAYRKTHLFGDLDRAQFSAGDTASQVFTSHGWRLGLLICYDVEFPEPARTVALGGAELILTVSANMAPFAGEHDLFARARAVENHVPHVYVNRIGVESGFDFVGGSLAVEPDGTVLASLGAGADPVVRVVDVPVGVPLDPRRYPDYLGERRPDVPAVVLPAPE